MTTSPVVLPPGEGRAIWQLGNRFTLKAGGDQTQGRLAVLEQVCGGAPPPLHVHTHDHEAFYVLEGTLELHVGDDVAQVGAGAFCLVPPGLPHTFRSTGTEPARLLVLVAPSGFEAFLAEVEQTFPEADGMPAPDDVGPVLAGLAASYGVAITGPPPG